MRLALALLAMALTTTAHAAQKRANPPPLDVTPEEELPVPPIPPSSEGSYLAAPMPNMALGAPLELSENTGRGTKVTPGFYHPKDYNLGEGYLSGSTVQGEQERRAQPVPRLQFKMPLE